MADDALQRAKWRLPSSQSSDAPVCNYRPIANRSCEAHRLPRTSQLAGSNNTFAPFAFPRGMFYLGGRRGINPELGRDHLWLPVVHTHTQQHPFQPGLWFYYARGCSDFTWDAGRVLLVRNRCELALLLEQRVSARIVSARSAARSVARKLMRLHELTLSGRLPRMVKDIFTRSTEAILGVPGASRSEADLTTALENCARGELTAPDSRQQCREPEGSLVELNLLDYLSAALLTYSSLGKEKLIDTVQFINSCSERNSAAVLKSSCCTLGIEIWDVRSLQLVGTRRWNRFRATATSLRQELSGLRLLWGGMDGSPCALSPDWPMCLACNASRTERACAFRCRARHGRLKRGEPRTYYLTSEEAGQVVYGGRDHSAIGYLLKPVLGSQHPLTKSTAWASSWLPVVSAVHNVTGGFGVIGASAWLAGPSV